MWETLKEEAYWESFTDWTVREGGAFSWNWMVTTAMAELNPPPGIKPIKDGMRWGS